MVPRTSVPQIPRTPAYKAGSAATQETAAYWPAWTSGDSGTLPAARLSLDRTRDLVRNDPHASAAVMRLLDMLVGSGWLMTSKPDARALGITPDQAREIGRQIETEWRLYCNDPRKFADSRRRVTMNGILRLLGRTFIQAGEAVAIMKFREPPTGRTGSHRYATCVRPVDPDRLSNPDSAPDTATLRGGVRFDAEGVPLSGFIRNGHPADWWAAHDSLTWTEVPFETGWGRPVLIHGFEAEREDQTRAITPFASLVSRLRMIGSFADTELANATANALFAAFIETDRTVEEANQALAPTDATYAGKVVDFYTDHPRYLGGVRLPVMYPGTRVAMNNAPRQTTAFPAFQTAFLQSLASAIGISYEQLSMDWSKSTWSSARAALAEVWRSIRRLQAVFREQIVQPIFFAWLEEAFDRGYIVVPAGAPSFWDRPDAYCAARWIGPGKGYVDPVTEAEAAALRMETLTSTLENECAEVGQPFEEVLDQIQREEEELARRNLSRQSVVSAVMAAKTSRPIPQNEDTAKPAEDQPAAPSAPQPGKTRP